MAVGLLHKLAAWALASTNIYGAKNGWVGEYYGRSLHYVSYDCFYLFDQTGNKVSN